MGCDVSLAPTAAGLNMAGPFLQEGRKEGRKEGRTGSAAAEGDTERRGDNEGKGTADPSKEQAIEQQSTR